MVKTTKSISLDTTEWQFLEEMSKETGKTLSEIISDLLRREMKNKEVNKHEDG